MTASEVRSTAPTRPRPRPPLGWLLRTAAGRARVQWRLLSVVLVVGVLVSALVSTLTLLVAATERTAVRDTLGAAPADRTELVLRIDRPRMTVADLRAATDATMRRLLGAEAHAVLQAVSMPAALEREGTADALAYLAELDGVADQATLLDGTWPDADAAGRDPLPVAVPAPAAAALDLEVGDVVALGPVANTDAEVAPVDVEVVGVFEPANPRAAYWAPDPLSAAGHSGDYIVPGSGGVLRTDAVGPFVVPAGALAARDVPLTDAHLRYAPDFAGAEVVELAALQGRLQNASTDVPRELGSTGRTVTLTTDLGRYVGEITAAVLVTRAGLTVAGLLLLLLAVAALLQTARLLADARAGEHDLMRARGAANRQVVAATAIEAGALGAVTAAAGPLLAPYVHRGLAALQRATSDAAAGAPDAGAADGAGVASGVPMLAQVPTLTWAAAAGVGLLLAVVLVSPLLRAPDTFVEGQQARGRDRRAMLARSGFDVLVVVLAAVAYVQLQAYRSPLTGSGASLRVDPVLVVGPAVVLLAGALLCVRLLPTAARLTERVAARGRGVVGPLAAWEIGRRSSRATAAVLLLTLALAVSTFSQSFLATWHRSQGDQAEFASGAPVRVRADVEALGRQAAALAADGLDPAQPVVRVHARNGVVAKFDPLVGSGFRSLSGPQAEVLALTPRARQMLDRGRMAEEGGATIAAIPTREPVAEAGIDLGEDVAGLSFVLAADAGDYPLPNAGLTLRLLVRDGSGVITVLDGGSVTVDAGPRQVDVLLDGRRAATGERAAEHAAARQYPLELVGLQVLLAGDYATGDAPRTDRYRVAVTIDDLAALRPGEPDDDAPSLEERLAAWDGTGPMPTDPPDGLVRDRLPDPATRAWPRASVNADVVGLDPALAGPGTIGFTITGQFFDLVVSPAQVTLTSWSPESPSGAVLTRGLAERLGVGVGDTVHVGLEGAQVIAEVTGLVDRVPTTRGGDAAVVDFDAVSRAVALRTALGAPVDEWWVDVPDDRVEAWLAALPETADGSPGASLATAQVRETADLREHPLRVATPMALWLVTAGAALVAAVGFAVHAAVTLRSRELEFAQLRAVGLQRRRVVAVVAIESLLMSGLGALFGVAIGAALGWLVGPLVAVSADGTPPVPDVLVVIPWVQVAAVVGGLVALVAVVVGAVAWSQRSADPAGVLREERAR